VDCGCAPCRQTRVPDVRQECRGLPVGATFLSAAVTVRRPVRQSRLPEPVRLRNTSAAPGSSPPEDVPVNHRVAALHPTPVRRGQATHRTCHHVTAGRVTDVLVHHVPGSAGQVLRIVPFSPGDAG
jgi:hypothetical protein